MGSTWGTRRGILRGCPSLCTPAQYILAMNKPDAYGEKYSQFRCGARYIFVAFTIVFLVGAVIFPYGYDKAFVRFPLPGYATYRDSTAVIEATKFPAASGKSTGVCAAKLWF